MQTYIGVKIVRAEEMTRQQFHEYMKDAGTTIPAKDDVDMEESGYLVEYPDSKHKNHPNHDGYVSWCPEDTFLAANSPANGMPFGHAIEAAKEGKKIARAGWNGKGMFVVLMSSLYLPPYNTQGTARKVNDRTAKWIGEDQPLDSQAYFAMFTAQKKWQPGWLANQADMLADDWQIID